MDSKILLDSIQEWLHLKNKSSSEGLAEPPLPTELFNADQLERHGITLALSHSLVKKNVSDILLKRLSESEKILTHSCNALSVKSMDGFSPAREWLLDNFYLIQEQILSIRRHLPKDYGRTLPQLEAKMSGYPRVYDIALEIIRHGDGRWDLENLSRFINAYQTITSLTLGELWAIPITLGVALIENLSTASQRIVADSQDRQLAAIWADRMVEVAVSEPKKLVIIIADMARSDPPTSSAFVAELSRRLQGASLALPLTWIEQHLAEEGLTVEQLVQEEHRHQAANQVTVSNSISSLRRLGEVDWRDFVEAMSKVEQTLKTDPSLTYSNMDFNTRDRYRHVIECLSRLSKRPELDVTLSAIQLSQPSTHVGFYLIGKGLPQLELALNIRPSLEKTVRHWIAKRPLLNYLGCIFLMTMALTLGLLSHLSQNEFSIIFLCVLGIALAFYGSQLSVALVNLISTLLIKPESLPRMDFSKGIPEACRTLVVVPAMLGSASSIESLVESLEVRFLGNRDPQLYFMLLTDFNDALKESMPEDEAQLTLAKNLINGLNEQYAKKNETIFFLCQRPRMWNDSEKLWMGKERKRGKLLDLNNLLRGNVESNFSLIIGPTDILLKIKYIITLDLDTQLPRDSARQLIGTMAHPLNQPKLDARKQRVIEGYGILQPRVSEALSLSGQTPYVKICGASFGVDPYTRTVSDVYQDLFHEGSFVGKGIYDVDVFQTILGECFPNNRILSHDLLEGCYLHSGFLSDVPLYEKSPSSYLVDVKRKIRWIRGDWQLISWLLPRVSKADGSRVSNPLSALSKFKLFDNLRRSLVPIVLLFLFGLTWTVLSDSIFWLSALFIMVILPAVIKTILELLRKPSDTLANQHIAMTVKAAYQGTEQLMLYLACLPHEAWYSFKAIVLTCFRVWFSKRHLLEWTPSDQIEFKKTLSEWLISMWMGPVFSLTVMVVLLIDHRFDSLLIAAPLLILWLSSPFLMKWVSQPVARVQPKLDANQIRFLHIVARKTWGFFETFITSENHYLPPDNFQEAPVEVLARRTSPTNIGLSMLANLTAYDFGYISMDQCLNRLSNALTTINQLERYHGHLYNWYSTETLMPLSPRYISTVDSANFSGHLLTLRQGLLALLDQPLLNANYFDGLEDTVDVLDSLAKSEKNLLKKFKQILQDARLAFSSFPKTLEECDSLCAVAEEIANEAALNNLEDWSHKLVLQTNAVRDEFRQFSNQTLEANTTLRKLAMKNAIAKDRIVLIDSLSKQLFSLSQMDVGFLYDEESHLMSIGFNVDTQERDLSDYDLLSSEARLGNFIAIAQGQIPQESWFALGRLLVESGREPVLISWSGSMFEYLMPLLIMPTYPETLLDQTYHACVNQQINYGKQRGVPWGISESGYNAFDTQFNYLYRAFGVPGLGLKRGLEEDLVIAPYASAMALMVTPEAACLNLQRLANDLHALGQYGFYEAIDFTASRLPRDTKRIIVRSFMAHHQGMSFLSLSYLLHHQPMQRRFIADPLFQATLLLLQERIPKPTASYLKIPKSADHNVSFNRPEMSMRVFNSPNTRTPQVQLLSNGNYHMVVTQAGGGYSRWKDIAVTRWREDTTTDNWGLFTYIRDISTGEFWSTTYQPTRRIPDEFKSVFSEAHAEFTRTDNKLHLHTEVVVSPEDDIELRRLRIHNRSKTRRTIEFTSYAEIVLAPQAADLSQPAFSNLFVETEILKEQHAILATRRPSDDQALPWLCHLLNVYSDHPVTLSFETDRARFLGRGRDLAAPLAMFEKGNLSNTAGAVLDPIIAIRCQITLEPDAFATFDLLTGMADTREHCVALVEKYQDRYLANRIFGLAWTHGQVLLHHLNITEANAQRYGKLASSIIYANNARRSDAKILMSNRRGQSGLWPYAISGDLPIVLLHIEDAANIELVQQLIQAQAYWKLKGLMVDLVILNQERISYRQTLQDQIMGLITGSNSSEHKGNIYVHLSEQMPVEDRILLESVARVSLSDQRGTLREQLNRRRVRPPVIPYLNLKKSARNAVTYLPTLPSNLVFFNGTGGFSSDGDEYFIQLKEGETTPAPWSNVLSNPDFGTLVSECGQGYTWIDNAHEFRLTPWENDPLKDSASEAIYLRDEETGLIWSPTALPCPGSGDYQTRHGFGYSVFMHNEDGIYSELWVYVALDASIKFMVLKLRNDSNRYRQLSATGYVAWVLGDLRSKNAMHVVTELSPGGLLIAQNHYNTEFGERTVFLDAATSHLELTTRTVTGDRTEFLGRNGSLRDPAALKRQRLSGRTGAGLDPCAAIQLSFELPKGQSRDIIFTLGAGKNKQDADALASRFHGVGPAQVALNTVRQYWQKTVGSLKVMTPDPAFNFLANGWLLYQVIASRLWGRSGYYQSGGAFGFRDQLQDVMSLSHATPGLFREQILLCAAHQFEEGDVQHWWHPPENRGVRTRCSDDYLWLPFAICHYIESTGDQGLLDEKIPFLQGRSLKVDEESYYELPLISTEIGTLYQHAVKAIQNGLRFGEHGLPLMGSGDWNDGMNKVGEQGKGESIWLAFFLYSVLTNFIPIAIRHGDQAFADECQSHSIKLQKQIEDHGWDGEWYRRAYFDNGQLLGSTQNTECRIDSIAQSWSVLSGAAGSDRRNKAMASLYQHLVSESDGLVKLLDPPFDISKPSPGYIQGYVPGIRENGGQYTHSAVWAAMAFAKLNEKELAWKLLNLLNPIHHARNKEEVERYKIEPYVIASDVYSVPPHTGQGGWTWYTGSAGWLYRLMTEILLGISLEEGKQLRLNPMLPDDWDEFNVDYHFGNSVYKILVSRNGKKELLLDNKIITGEVVPLVDDGEVHEVVINF